MITTLNSLEQALTDWSWLFDADSNVETTKKDGITMATGLIGKSACMVDKFDCMNTLSIFLAKPYRKNGYDFTGEVRMKIRALKQQYEKLRCVVEYTTYSIYPRINITISER